MQIHLHSTEMVNPKSSTIHLEIIVGVIVTLNDRSSCQTVWIKLIHCNNEMFDLEINGFLSKCLTDNKISKKIQDFPLHAKIIPTNIYGECLL